MLENGPTPGVREHDEFNEALLCCLLETPVRREMGVTAVYDPQGARPFSITNTHNRLVVNSYMIRWEPILAPQSTRE